MKNFYKHYKRTDFIKEQAFLDWLIEDKDKDAWLDWLYKNPTERQEVFAILALIKTKQLPTISLSTERLAVLNQQISKLNATTAVRDNLRTLPPKSFAKTTTKKQNSLGQLLPYIAAACLLLTTAFIFFGKKMTNTTIAADRAEQIKHTLPDGSIVNLNAASSLSYNEKNWDKERLIELEGEAFFEVKKGCAFKVKTDKGVVTVLGTTFNVNARNDRMEVACFTGMVKVKKKKTGEIAKLRSREQVLVSDQNFEKSLFDMSAYATWRKGSFYYKGQTAGRILEEIERQYNVKIKVSNNLKERPLDFFFDLREPVDNTVMNIGKLLNAKVEINKDTIRLS